MKRGYEDVFVFAGMLFMSDYKFNYFFSMERGYRSVLGYGYICVGFVGMLF